MAHNLLVTYDLISPGQNYEAVQARIQSLGQWYKLQYSAYYVSSGLNADDAHNFVRQVLDPNDKLAVADMKRLVVSPVQAGDLAAINREWFKDGANPAAAYR